MKGILRPQSSKLTQSHWIVVHRHSETYYLAITMKIPLLIFAGLCVLGSISCSKPVAPEYLGFRDLVFEKFSMDESLLHTNLAFYNPNPFNMQLTRADINLYLNDDLANHYVMDSTILIPKKDSFLIPLNLRLNPRLLLGSALKMLMNNNMVKIRLEGIVKVKRSSVGFTVPVHYEELQKLDINF